MTTKNKTLIGIAGLVASLTTIGVIIYLSWKKNVKKQQEMLDKVADEGYETAYDVLYPLKKRQARRFL